jgi:transcriptional regulator with XRE-family HTH domain
MTESGPSDFGRLLRLWRNHARMSQLELAARAEMSQRHLSFIETGRARPGADVVHRVGEALALPLRDRNRLMAAAGLAPHYPEVSLDAASVAPFRSAIRRLLEAHEPFPAFVLDRWWDVVDANRAGQRLFPRVGESYTNVVEAFLAPGGLRDMVVNFPEVASMYLRRLEADVAEASDDRLQATLRRARELLADVELIDVDDASDLVICPRLRLGDEIVGTVTMVARFGATRAVTLDELRVELIFPADDIANEWFRQAARAEA